MAFSAFNFRLNSFDACAASFGRNYFSSFSPLSWFSGLKFPTFSHFYTPNYNYFSASSSIFPRYSSSLSTYSPYSFGTFSASGNYSAGYSNESLLSRFNAIRANSLKGTSLFSTRSVSNPVATRTYAPMKVSADFKQRLKNLGPEFLNKVKRISKTINCDYQDLLAVMNAESGLDHTIQNKAGHHYYGLIQFGEDAARSVGTTTDKLVRMSALEQLDYVEKYFLHKRKSRGWGNKKLSAADLYALVFAPARAKNEVMYTRNADVKAYRANSTIDTKFGNGDGIISKNELQNFMDTKRIDENLFLA